MTTIVGTAAGRPHYLRQALSSWCDVPDIEEHEMWWFVEPLDISHVEKTFTDYGPSGLTYEVNRQVYGPLGNPHHAFESAFKRGDDFVVYAEDDVIVARDILEYYHWARDEFRDNKQVLAVCAFSKDGGLYPDDYRSVRLQTGFCPIGWATWSDRWQFISDNWDFDYSTGGGDNCGWDHNLNLRLVPQYDLRTVHPLWSRTQHIGEHGAHCRPEIFPPTQTRHFSAQMRIPDREEYPWHVK